MSYPILNILKIHVARDSQIAIKTCSSIIVKVVARLTNQDREVVETRSQESKQLPISPILSNNYQLRSIVVNKDRIHRELR